MFLASTEIIVLKEEEPMIKIVTGAVMISAEVLAATLDSTAKRLRRLCDRMSGVVCDGR